MDNIQTHEEMNEDTVESAEHVEEMLQKADELEKANSPVERPEWLPEKFASVEQMAEAYKNLEQKLGSQGQEEQTEEVEYEEQGEMPDSSQVEQVITEAGMDFNAMQAEYAQNGGLSDETYEALNENGFPPELVDSWIQGQEALVNNFQSSIFEQVGGQDNYAQILSWASENLSEAEIQAYDNAIDSGDLGTVQLALSGLQTKFQSDAGVDPSLFEGQSTTTSGGAYGSWAEATVDIGNPRYENDPAFREQVAAKLMRSKLD